MKFSCDQCPVKGLRCDGCMMTVLAHPVFRAAQPRPTHLDDEDTRVLGLLVDSGLVDPREAVEARVESVPVYRVRAVG